MFGYLKHILSLLAIVFVQLQTVAQPTTDEQLAQQFYQNKEFDKALNYYEKLYTKTSSQEFYTPYLNCLLETKDFKKAESALDPENKFYADLFVTKAFSEYYLKQTKNAQEDFPAVKYPY